MPSSQEIQMRGGKNSNISHECRHRQVVEEDIYLRLNRGDIERDD